MFASAKTMSLGCTVQADCLVGCKVDSCEWSDHRVLVTDMQLVLWQLLVTVLRPSLLRLVVATILQLMLMLETDLQPGKHYQVLTPMLKNA